MGHRRGGRRVGVVPAVRGPERPRLGDGATVDPALLEWAGTGRLNLRVYPIPARQDKRIMLAYTQSLPKLYEDWTITVPFPELDQPVGDVAFDVRIKGCKTCEVTSTSHQLATKLDGDDAIVSYHHTGERLGDSLVLHVRDARTQPTVVTAGAGDDRYLMVRAPSDLRGDARPYRPATWVILDDVSASRGVMERRAQADLVDAFLGELDEEDRVAVVAFDVTTRELLPPTRVLDVDRRAVRKALDREGDVGATDFSVALDAATRLLATTAPDDAMIVYLGDGVITSGARKLDALRAQLAHRARFIGVGVGDGPDTQTLEALAASTGGFATTIDLADDVAWRAFDLVAALHTARATGLEARLVDAQGGLVPSTSYLRAAQVADGEELELVGKLAGAGTPVAVVLTGARDGQPWTQRIDLATATRPVGDAAYLPRLWAQRHVAARMLAKHEAVVVPLCTSAKAACPTEREVREARDEQIRQEVVGLGKKYFLLSRHTSLLVLENDAMYAQYGVTKGAGDTWATYAMPAKIPVVVDPRTPSTTAASVAPAAELVRAPLPYFYDYSAYNYGGARGLDDGIADGIADGIDGGFFGNEQGEETGGIGLGRSGARISDRAAGPMASRADLGLGGERETAATEAKAMANVDAVLGQPLTLSTGHAATVDKQQMTVDSDEMFGGKGAGMGGGGIGLGGLGTTSAYAQRMTLIRFTQPADPAFHDLTAWVPALQRDGFATWRRQLVALGGDAPHTIDAGARDLLAQARAALPTGVYRWDDLEVAVDAQRHVGWRRITDANLHETASFDGATWTRRYAELGLDVTRAVGDDAVALYLSYLPLLVADPAQYARWFDVTSAKHRVVLSTKDRAGKPTVRYQLELDDQARVVALTDGDGARLVEIAWSSTWPMAAKVMGRAVEVGFVAQAMTDAMSWAHQAPAQAVVVELPLHLVPFAHDQVKLAPVGSGSWRQAQRQLMASYLAMQQPGGAAVYRELAAHGGVELGDLVLAAPGLMATSSDKELADALAPFGTSPDRAVVARYLQASRTYARDGRPASLAHPTEGGLVAQLFTLREASAKLAAGRGKAAVDTLLTLDGRATALRTIGAAMASARYEVPAVDVARVWESAAIGAMKNIARAQAAEALWNRGDYEAGAERIAALVADLDLRARPPRLDLAPQMFNASRRGGAGWQLVWASWRERVLAGGDYDHVMALLSAAYQNADDQQAILTRAAALVGDDVDARLGLARIALARNQLPFAQGLVEPLLKIHPTRAVYALAARLAMTQGRTADALAALEAAQAVGGDEPVGIATVRGELAQIIALARQLAVQATGPARQDAVDRALAWGAKWRAIDQGNPQIDQVLGDLLLAVGDTAGAWRQLSTVIERAPMAGDGYMTVAETFERQGRVAEAVELWQQALVLDQTNPTPRFRKAQALIALGKAAEGDALLRDIANGRWHEQWSGIVWQARGLIDRGKPPR
ncbi:MAG: hypothetical protein NT062_01305 [Proteobacteria bacterium]|nr:hypothetical protein [Pseudomonadota bacterium]